MLTIVGSEPGLVSFGSGKLPQIGNKSSPTLFTRQALQNTLDIYGYREKATITHSDDGVQNCKGKGKKLLRLKQSRLEGY